MSRGVEDREVIGGPPKPWMQYASAAVAPISKTVVGLGSVVATNATMASYASTAGGGPEIAWIALLLNGIAQGLKNLKWFNEHLWLAPVLFVAGGALVWFIWGDHIRALADATLSTTQAIINYKGQDFSTTPNLMPATPPKNEYSPPWQKRSV